MSSIFQSSLWFISCQCLSALKDDYRMFHKMVEQQQLYQIMFSIYFIISLKFFHIFESPASPSFRTSSIHPLFLSFSLSLTLTHTHTYTHSLSLWHRHTNYSYVYLSLSHTPSLSLSLPAPLSILSPNLKSSCIFSLRTKWLCKFFSTPGLREFSRKITLYK